MFICLNLLEENEVQHFENVYENNYLKMYHIALSILKQKEDAENAVHDAFVSLAENFSKYKFLDSLKMKSLCNVIVRNKSLDLLRKRDVRSECELTDDYAIEKYKETEEFVIGEEGKNLILSFLENMDEEIKIIFILKYYHAYSNGEIAKILNITKRSVEMKVYRAKERLKKELKNNE